MEWFRRGAQVTAGALAVVLVALLLYTVRSVLVLILLGILLAEAIAPLVLRLGQFGARRAQAVLLIYAALGCIVGVMGWLLAQAVSRELEELAANLPQLQAQLASAVAAIPIPQLREAASRSLGATSAQPLSVADGVPRVLETGVSVLQGVFGAVSILVIAFYWIAEQRAIRGALLGLLPEARQPRGTQIWEHVEHRIGAWVRAQLILMLAIGVTFAIGLALFGVRYSVLLGAVAACAELLPVVGPWIGTAPAVMIALTQSPQLALLVLVFGIVVQMLETNVLIPRLLGHATGISPLVVFVSILVGAELLGVVGALLAVPVAAAVQALLEDLRGPTLIVPRDEPQPASREEAA